MHDNMGNLTMEISARLIETSNVSCQDSPWKQARSSLADTTSQGRRRADSIYTSRHLPQQELQSIGRRGPEYKVMDSIFLIIRH